MTARAQLTPSDTDRPGLIDRMARQGVLNLLAKLHDGQLAVHENGRSAVFGAPARDDSGLRAEIRVHRPGFWTETALGGPVGAAESFAHGDWDSDDLTSVIRILARHSELVAGLDSGWANLRRWVLQTLEGLRRNTRAGARRNIAAHYDLGNDFFASFLDPAMMYSSAVFPTLGADLEQAARFKLDLICRKLGLSARHELVEIGSGWGGFAIHAASRYGCRVTTTTISKAQYDETVARVQRAGLADRITVLFDDYRDLPPRLNRNFDRLVSIEMIEAVGHEFLPQFFRVCGQLLKPDGQGLIQAIVIRDQDYDNYRKSIDFIRRYIFPGGCLPCVSRMVKAVADFTRMRVDALEDLTPHYVETLRAWRQRFEANCTGSPLAHGDPTFRRLWQWYFAYCEAGFLERCIGLVHLRLAGPEAGVGPLSAPYLSHSPGDPRLLTTDADSPRAVGGWPWTL